MSEGDAVSTEERLQRIRHDQELALELIVGDQSPVALSLLEQISTQLQEFEGSFEWVRQPYLLARAYAADYHRCAEPFFIEAVTRVSKLPECDPQHSLLVHKSFGKYLSGIGKVQRALKEYERAEEVAMALGPSEELDQLHMRIIETRLRVNKDQVGLSNIQLFKNVALEMRSTFGNQRRAWMKLEGSLECATDEALFMRNTRRLDTAYFKYLLEATRESEIER